MNRPLLETAIRQRLVEASRVAVNGQSAAAWTLLEDAHILSQPLAGPHVRVHTAMLRLAVAERDLREVAGQAVRLVLAGPGSLLGRYPAGNSGRARVSAFKRAPIRPDLAEILAAASDGDR